MAKIKQLISILLLFYKQLRIRPLLNNLSLLIININILFRKNHEMYYLKKHSLNRSLLKNIIKLPTNDEKATNVDKYNVWVLWWQGENDMPPIVKCTYQSIKDMADRNVILITNKNWTEFITPELWIIEKLKTQKMTLQALSDYIRASLLYQYGGLWIDSTVLCTDKIPNFIYESTLFSVHSKMNTNKYVSMGRWNVQILGTNKKHLYLFKCIKYIFEEYWKKYDNIMDYLLVDYSIDYVYNSDNISQKLIDSIPYTNPHMHELRTIINDSFDQSRYDSLKNDTVFFKLTYKMGIKEKSSQYTYYTYLMETLKHKINER